MNTAQIDQMLADLPPTLDQRHRRRITGYAAAARRCDQRIAARRAELEDALRVLDDAAAVGNPDQAADDALGLTLELDALERVQPRIDSRLRGAAGAVAEDPRPAPFGEGPA
jgi:hypothetical protein